MRVVARRAAKDAQSLAKTARGQRLVSAYNLVQGHSCRAAFKNKSHENRSLQIQSQRDLCGAPVFGPACQYVVRRRPIGVGVRRVDRRADHSDETASSKRSRASHQSPDRQ